MPSDDPGNHRENDCTAFSDLKISLGPVEVLHRTRLPDRQARRLADVPMALTSTVPAAGFTLMWMNGAPLWACVMMPLLPYLLVLAGARVGRGKRAGRSRCRGPREIRLVLGD